MAKRRKKTTESINNSQPSIILKVQNKHIVHGPHQIKKKESMFFGIEGVLTSVISID